MDTVPISMTLALVALIPMELYFMPRFLLFLDAEALDHSENPAQSWSMTFENRWMRAFVAKALLYSVAFTIGAICLLIPGVLILAVFGWMPYRVLLRGEPLRKAAKSSAALTARFWPHVLMPVAAVIALYSLVLWGAMVFESHFIPEPSTAWVRLSHPAVWAVEFAGGLENIWVSATLLAVYHRLERMQADLPVPPEAE